MARLRYNGLVTSLGGSGLTNVATAVTFSAALTYNNGNSSVPTIVSPDYIPLSIIDPASGLVSEIVYLTAYTTGATTGTITRGQEGTTAAAQAVGRSVQQSLTAFDFGVATAYTPAWAGAGASQPTLGTGGTAVGFYTLLGPLCYFTAIITLGTAPGLGTAGSQYSISLPPSPYIPAKECSVEGTLRFGGNPWAFVADLTVGGTTVVPKVTPGTAGNAFANWTSANPSAPVAGAVFRVSGCYFWTN